ncbi:von Willebrand factor C and EGF domain-containing protein [Ochotona curzoniae]|uniref:von Willebrand factor C and EGF domain-containing protein n=1 Tax=Ochotona curzoniae TaxID=130825 RepID=UPI001B350050|nr:von Willebrand factor C and EGF domain-containing protein [Ochotona curzoniae]
MWAGLLLRAACVALLLLGAMARSYTGRKPPGHFATERRRLGPHVCLSGFGSGCCPGWAPSMGGGHCTLPLCSFGCGSGVCIAPNVCSCQDGEQGATCPEAHRPCGEYGCDLTCNHGGCQEVARVCPVGFLMTETAVGIRCTDIDECLSSACEGHCVNTEGGFVCECGPGMQLSADRHSCQDTDECLRTPCQQRCKNSIGSYRCSCRPGFHLHGNRHSCVDINECRKPLERRVCHHSCHNTVGSFMCTCRPGFRLRADRVSCEAFPKAVLAPSAIMQPRQHPAKMLLLLPEAGRPVLPPGHSPPPGAPGYLAAGGRTTRPAASSTPVSSSSAPPRLFVTPTATPVPSASLLGSLRPPSFLQGEAVGTLPSPRGPEASSLAAGRPPCWHLGVVYESGSHWTEARCSQCRCQDGEVTCSKVRCEAACSHPIPPRDGGCCPLCTGCFHHGVIRAEGDVFSPPNENCTVCVCLAGNVTCISPECPPGPCQASPQSDCCACVPGRCYFHGQWYADGAVFSGGADECTTCVCQNGEVACSFRPCPDLACPREEWWLGPGQCCFTCREPRPITGCSLDDNGIEFPIGQIWSPGDPCELCICQADGSVKCKRTDCVDSCPHPIQIPGQCCPDCSAGCTYTGRIFYNNETFPSVLDPCLSCICLLGSVACSPMDCPITCTYPFHPDGECCPVCWDCNYEGRKVGNGQVFALDDEPCTRCICQLGEVSCERIPCQWACVDPTLLSGDCCSSCPEVLFAAEERQGPVPHRDGAVDLDKAARSPRGDATAPVNCTSSPGPPPALPARSTLPLLQRLLGANSDAHASPGRPSGAPASSSPALGPEGSTRGEPGRSQPPPLSPRPSVPPGASTPPPAPPGAPWPPPVTPARGPAASSGSRTVSRRSTTLPTQVAALSTLGPSEASTRPLGPRGLSAATSRLAAAAPASARPRAQPPSEKTPRGEDAML